MASSSVRASARVLIVIGLLAAVPGDALAIVFSYPDPSGNAPLDGPGGTSLTGSYWLAMPAEAVRVTPAGGVEVNLVNCGTFLSANPNGMLNIPNATRFARFERSTNTFVDCACPGPNCFSLVSGDAYLLQISAASTFSIFGSHAYTMIPLLGPGAGSLDGTNLISLPWPTSLSAASQLQQSVGFANTTSVQRYLTASDALQVYTGRKGGGLDFPLYDTVGYAVRVASTTYWAAPDPSTTTCDSVSGTFPAGSNAEAMATTFNAAFAAKVTGSVSPSPFVDYTSTNLATPDGKVMITKTSSVTPCLPPPTNFGIVFTVPGGTTAAIHPFGYQLCCNSPLAQSIGVDGARAVSLDNTSRNFGEFSVASASEDLASGATVPALGAGWMIGLVAALLGVGIWLRSR